MVEEYSAYVGLDVHKETIAVALAVLGLVDQGMVATVIGGQSRPFFLVKLVLRWG